MRKCDYTGLLLELEKKYLNVCVLLKVKVVCETRGPDHMDQLRDMIATAYREWEFSREFDRLSPGRSEDSLDVVSP